MRPTQIIAFSSSIFARSLISEGFHLSPTPRRVVFASTSLGFQAHLSESTEAATLRSVTFCNLPIDEEPDLLCDLLLELGACSASVVDADAGTSSERPIFSDSWNESRIWKRSNVTAHFPSSISIEGVCEVVREHWDAGVDKSISLVTTVPDRDWVVHVQSNWKPIVVANKFVLRFPWHDDQDVLEQTGGKEATLIPLQLQGGVAFGTGEHATTQLCLEWLVNSTMLSSDTTVLDYGAGSGILGMAACALGAASAVGVDIDTDACRVANANAMANNVSMKCFLPHLSSTATDDESRSLLVKSHSSTVSLADSDDLLDLDENQTFGVVVANILAAPLVKLAPTLWAMTQPGGCIGLSGILAHQQGDLVKEYSSIGFNDVSVIKEMDGWVLIGGVRPKHS